VSVTVVTRGHLVENPIVQEPQIRPRTQVSLLWREAGGKLQYFTGEVSATQLEIIENGDGVLTVHIKKTAP